MKLIALLFLALTGLAAPALAQPAPAGQVNVNGQTITSSIQVCWNGATFAVCNNPSNGSPSAPTTTTPSVATPYDLDNATVTTAGTAVNALNAGNAGRGGFIKAVSATLCIRESTGAAGIVDGVSGTVCIATGQTYTLVGQAGAISVNSPTAGALIAGKGYK